MQVNSIAKWDGTQWWTLGAGMSGGDEGQGVYALAVIKGDLYAGGDFTVAGSTSVGNIAKWDGAQWWALVNADGTTNNTPTGSIYALTDMNETVVAGDTNATISQWDETASMWSNLGIMSGGGDYGIESLLFMSSSNTLYAGGGFTDSRANYIAQLNMSTVGADWQPVGGNVLNSDVYALTNMNGTLYAGGDFNVTNLSLQYAAQLSSDGKSLLPVGAGFDSDVYAFTIMNNNLYAGGWFNFSALSALNAIAELISSAWSPVGPSGDPGMNSGVYSLANISNTSPQLYVGGDFTADYKTGESEDPWLYYIAMWDGTNWNPLANGVDYDVYALAIAPALNITGFYSPP